VRDAFAAWKQGLPAVVLVHEPFATLAELNSLWSTAPDGSMALTLDESKLYPRRTGAWQPHYNFNRANYTFDASGLAVVTHGLGRTPFVVIANAHQAANVTLSVTALTSTTFTVRCITANTNANYVGVLSVAWWAT
jgi:hypothetical protein